MATKKDPDDILEDIQRVAEKLGKPPSTDEYREHGSVTVPTVYNHFDGFVAAREAAAVSEGELTPNTREELLEDIRKVAEEVDGEPSWGDYKDGGNYAIKGITYRFGTWNEAKKAAGVYKRENHELTREMLIEDMQRVDRERSGALTQVTYNEWGKHTSRSVQRKFGSWENGCHIADVTRPDKGPRPERSEELVEDIKTVADDLGRLPSRSEYNDDGEFTRQMAIDRYGSWNNAVREAGFEPNDPGAQYGEMHPNWKGGGQLYYGPNYHSQRESARERDGYECRECGMGDEHHKEQYGCELDMHHIKAARTFGEDFEAMNALDNLITLCNSCHKKYEYLPNKAAKELIEGE